MQINVKAHVTREFLDKSDGDLKQKWQIAIQKNCIFAKTWIKYLFNKN